MKRSYQRALLQGFGVCFSLCSLIAICPCTVLFELYMLRTEEYHLGVAVRVATTKYCKVKSMNTRNLFLIVPEARKPKIKALAYLVPVFLQEEVFVLDPLIVGGRTLVSLATYKDINLTCHGVIFITEPHPQTSML